MAIKITIPTEWSDITIGQLLEFKKVDGITNEYDVARHILSIFTTINDEEIDRLESNQVYDVVNAISDLVQTPLPSDLKMVVEIEGKEYGMMPNLGKHKFKEEADLSMLCKTEEDLHRFMSVLYRPIKSKVKDFVKGGYLYDIEDYNPNDLEERAEVFYRSMPITVANGASVFFYNIAKNFTDVFSKAMENQSPTSSQQNGERT